MAAYPTSVWIINTLNGRLEELRTIIPGMVLMYICGPTVYDSTHLGHARTYVTFDIVRRILEDYFCLRVRCQCNITDVDDKIIARAVERSLSIFDICRRYEHEFLNDMYSLGVRPFTELTRVTEYMAEIIHFIQKILDGGFAYISNGSVYFDVEAARARGYAYPKLRPLGSDSEALQQLLQNVDGADSKNRVAEKRSSSDFALWKAWKETEPDDSKWNATFHYTVDGKATETCLPGRPGWHIECSAMASAVLGKETCGAFDLHLGGCDLQFPHHDNELIQSETWAQRKGMINYFMHSGHLKIAGDTMSKSKKNFTTVRDILSIYTRNQVRMLFCLVPYSASLDYSLSMMEAAVAKDKKISTFILNCNQLIQQSKKDQSAAATLRYDNAEETLAKQNIVFLSDIDASFRRDMDIVSAVGHIMALIDSCKAYIFSCQSASKPVNVPLIVHSRDKVIRVLSIMGFSYTSTGAGSSSGDDEQDVMKVAKVLCDFRTEVRNTVMKASVAGEADFGALKKSLLRLCDELRDDRLPPTGFAVEDTESGSFVKQIDVEEWKIQKQRELELAEAKRLHQEKVQREKLEKQRLEREKALIPAEKMFLDSTEFSLFNERGIPTHLAEKGEDGEYLPLPKSRAKRLVKEWEAQKKLNEKYKDQAAEPE